MTKGQITIRIIAGGYLAYLGLGLVRDMIMKKPDNHIIYLLFGILFIIVGAVWCFLALRRYIRHDFADIGDNSKSVHEDRKEEDDENRNGI